MITHIRMKNFKSWKDSGEVKLAPLTGFFGTNSSGKSSMLQMMLLLKQTIGSKEVLFFGDENSLVNLGSFREVIHGHKKKELLELEFGCKLQKPLTIKMPHGESHFFYTHRSLDLDIDSFTFDTTIQVGNGKPIVENLRYRTGLDPVVEIRWTENFLHYGDKRETVESVKNCYSVQVSSEDQFFEDLGKLSSAFESLFADLHYLGPIRGHPQRRYHWAEPLPESVGQSGVKTMDALLSARVDPFTTPHEEKEVQIEKRISAWLKKMELAYSFSLTRVGHQSEKEYEVRIQKSKYEVKVTLADIGYGLAQFLPILVLCYYAPRGSTLILEHPGNLLHPKVQSQLADLLIEVIMERNLQILIESHSEHLLNRLQRRIAEEKLPADQTALYFCRNDEGVSSIERLEMDELGNIKNWPPNFFGDEMGDLFAMTKAQRERQKRAEG